MKRSIRQQLEWIVDLLSEVQVVTDPEVDRLIHDATEKLNEAKERSSDDRVS